VVGGWSTPTEAVAHGQRRLLPTTESRTLKPQPHCVTRHRVRSRIHRRQGLATKMWPSGENTTCNRHRSTPNRRRPAAFCRELLPAPRGLVRCLLALSLFFGWVYLVSCLNCGAWSSDRSTGRGTFHGCSAWREAGGSLGGTMLLVILFVTGGGGLDPDPLRQRPAPHPCSGRVDGRRSAGGTRRPASSRWSRGICARLP
jgi:hypothetical protein